MKCNDVEYSYIQVNRNVKQNYTLNGTTVCNMIGFEICLQLC